MAKFKYTGPSGVWVGRFGPLNKGDVVDLWATEIESIENAPIPEEVTWQRVEPESTDGVGVIVPIASPHYDLTAINWKHDMFMEIRRIKSRTLTMELCRAMRDAGAVVPGDEELDTLTRDALVELAYGEAKRLRWDEWEPGSTPLPRVAPESVTAAPVEKLEAVEDTEGSEDPMGDDEPADEPTEPKVTKRKAARKVSRRKGK